ncbi:MAG: hypothetical protein J5I52_01700 [Saprospiraceae bacterium]|nr:hypothetical protein [Saprospiraceae bacterium]
MISTISFSYPLWYLLFCLIVGAGYALLMYYRDKRFSDYSIWLKRGLGLLRGLAAFLIALLLLSPFVKTIKEDIQQPIIVIASDNSQSIAASTNTDEIQTYQSQLTQLTKDLSEKFQVKKVTFGSEVYEDGRDSLKDKSTNISQLFKFISDNYGDQNLGALILGTDGIYNEGSNPLYVPYEVNAPVYTIALGDTTQRKDLYFQNVLHNKLAYLNDKFPVQVDVSGYNCEGETSKITLDIVSKNGTKRIAEETIQINAKDFFTTKTFLIDATQTGIVQYRLSLSTVNGEFNTSNNVKEFFIEVLDARQKILLLANAPHPDLGALKNLITINKNYEVEIGFLPEFKHNLAGYNLVILHNLPSETNDITSVLNQLNKNNIPRIFVVGMQTSVTRLNNAQEVIKIIGNSKNTEDIQAEFSTSFHQFTTSDELKNKLKIFPPLQAPFGEYKAGAGSSVFLNQSIKKIKTNYPLIAFDEKDGVKTAVITGEGIWRWRLFDYLQHNNYDLVHELVNKTILLTSIKTDKRKFRASTSKSLYKDNEQVIFDAQLYNDSYEMINEPDVNLVVKDENGKEFQYTFSKTQNYYTLNADLFTEGNYEYTASTHYNGKNQSVSGRFTVEPLQLEQYDLTARHGLLRNISEKYHGEMVFPKDMSKLKDLVLGNKQIKPMLYESRSTKGIIHLKSLFFLILGLLTIEWFLRRYFGNY